MTDGRHALPRWLATKTMLRLFAAGCYTKTTMSQPEKNSPETDPRHGRSRSRGRGCRTRWHAKCNAIYVKLDRGRVRRPCRLPFRRSNLIADQSSTSRIDESAARPGNPACATRETAASRERETE